MRPTGLSPAGASTTATAVSSQLVSMPRTRMRVF
jgi:adenylylsulfate kinase-like enzyme